MNIRSAFEIIASQEANDPVYTITDHGCAMIKISDRGINLAVLNPEIQSWFTQNKLSLGFSLVRLRQAMRLLELAAIKADTLEGLFQKIESLSKEEVTEDLRELFKPAEISLEEAAELTAYLDSDLEEERERPTTPTLGSF